MFGQVAVDIIHPRPDDDRSLNADSGEGVTTRIGGKAFNIAVAAARLGAQVDLVTAIGGDEFGREAIGLMRGLGVGQRLVQTGADLATPSVRLTEGRHGNRSVRVELDPRMSPLYREACSRFVADEFDVVVLTLEYPGDVLPTLAGAVRRARSRRAFVTCNAGPSREDPSLRPTLAELFRSCDVVVPNQYEAERLIGDAIPQPGRPR